MHSFQTSFSSNSATSDAPDHSIFFRSCQERSWLFLLSTATDLVPLPNHIPNHTSTKGLVLSSLSLQSKPLKNWIITARVARRASLVSHFRVVYFQLLRSFPKMSKNKQVPLSPQNWSIWPQLYWSFSPSYCPSSLCCMPWLPSPTASLSLCPTASIITWLITSLKSTYVLISSILIWPCYLNHLPLGTMVIFLFNIIPLLFFYRTQYGVVVWNLFADSSTLPSVKRET